MSSTTRKPATPHQQEIAKLREQIAATEAELARAKSDSVQWMLHYAGCAATIEHLRRIVADASRAGGRPPELAIDEAKHILASSVHPDSLLQLGNTVVDALALWWGEPSDSLVSRGYVKQWMFEQKPRARAQLTAFLDRLPVSRR